MHPTGVVAQGPSSHGSRPEGARRWAFVAAALLGLALSGTSAAGQEPPAAGAKKKTVRQDAEEYPIHGSLSLRYRLRMTDDDEHHDVYETLSVNFGDRNVHPVTGYLLARAAEGGGGSRLDGLADAFDGGVLAHLIEAYADAHRAPAMDLLRLGRQTLYETPVTVLFDGLRVETEQWTPVKLRLGAYGGVPTHLYDSGGSGDRVAGGFAQVKPWKGGRIRADGMRLEDETDEEDREDSLVGLAAWQAFTEQVQVHVRGTRVEGETRDTLVRGTYNSPDGSFMAQASAYTLLQEQSRRSLELDPFFDILLDYRPYRHYTALVSQSLGKALTLNAGAEARRLKDDSDESTFNHEFERYYATPVLQGFPWKGLCVSGTAEYWNSDEDDMKSWGAECSQAFGRDLKLTAGTQYARFKYDYFTAREREDVRTVYGKVCWKTGRSMRIDAGYEDERNEFDDLRTARLGVVWEF